MYKTIQIGNLGYSMDDRDLARLFTPYGVVRSATVCIHRNSGQSTGVGFVEMESEEEAESAVGALNGTLHCGRVLSLCLSVRESTSDVSPDEMFGPMNLIEESSPDDPAPERRGLP